MDETRAAEVEAPPATSPPSPRARRAFLASWLILTLAGAVLAIARLRLAAADCHGYEDELACDSTATVSIAAAVAVAVSLGGAFWSRRASRRQLLAALVALAAVVGVELWWLAREGPSSPPGVKHLDHF
jgi:drug/metabolite transporter (DMT)-like permease